MPTVLKDNAARAADAAAAALVAQARWFQVLGHPVRLAIVQNLLTGPHSVTELAAKAGLSQSRISNHLACLRWCRFVATERRGRHIVYSIADPRLQELLDTAGDLVSGIAGHLASCDSIGPEWI
jgi:ArsR family transcriptional regulator, cadmium/lead-responsive transcriptional repressor